jgi:hypothetical protein
MILLKGVTEIQPATGPCPANTAAHWFKSIAALCHARMKFNGAGFLGVLSLAACVLAVSPAVQASSIVWQGYNWALKSAVNSTPGPNNWNPANVFVDTNGYMHLEITYDTNSATWECADLFTTTSLGFGTYQWQVEGQIDTFDPWVVLGLFSYLGPSGTNEIDIEYTRWGQTDNHNGWWTIYPASGTTIGRSNCDFSLNGMYTTSRLAWSSSGVQFWLMSGFQPVGTTTNVIGSWNYSPSHPSQNIPQKAMPSIMNLWLYKGNAPANGQPVDVIIHNFTFSPSGVTNASLFWQGNGGQNFYYAVLPSTNVARPLTNWMILSTNSFKTNGTFTFTNAANPSAPATFFDTKAVP